jgi:ABC-type uncharacterized transport system substrate-binding protein
VILGYGSWPRSCRELARLTIKSRTRYSFLNCTATCSSTGFHSSCWLRTNACASVGVAGANGGPELRPFLQATHDLPIVFANVADPVGQGFVASLPRPGGNVTGFTSFEFGQSTKWLELLKEIAPRVTRAAVLLDRAFGASMAHLGAIQGVAPSFGVEVSSIDLRDAGEVQHAIIAFARAPNGGLIVTGGGSGARRELIITLAARHRLPAVHPFPYHVASGGLTSYGPDITDQYRLAAGYVDRILKGERPADLPVQTATKYKLVINLKTAKALGLEVPITLLARADEVIE